MSHGEPHGLRELSPEQYQRITNWRGRITEPWQRIARDVVETALALAAAHDDLLSIFGGWAAMIETLPFDRTVAHRLMAIARNAELVAHAQQVPSPLPVAWTTLSELSRFDGATLRALIKSGAVNPRTQRQDVKRLQRAVAAGRGIAFIAHKDTMTLANQRMWAEANRFVTAIWDRAKAGLLTDEELTGVFQTFLKVNELFGASAELMSTKWYSEPMKTINEPMWSDNDERNHATHGTTAQCDTDADSTDP
jgi:hypothetical protein